MRLVGLLARSDVGRSPLEAYQRRAGKVGTPGASDRRSHRRADPRDRGADPADRRDQAPGEDRHRRDLPQRRGHARPRARAGGARRRRRARRAQLPGAQGARRPRPGGRRGRRVHALRASTATRDHRSSTAVASPATCRAGSSATRSSSAPSGASRPSAGARRPGPQRRPHGDLRARGEGAARARASRCCTCASTTASPPATMRGVLQGYDHRYDRLVDWVTETEGSFHDRPARRPAGRRPADQADLRDRRSLAVR